MKNTLRLAISGLLLISSAYLHAESVRVVSIRNNEICLGDIADAKYESDKCLTSDGTEKYLPSWSKDGTQIAFIKQVSEFKALAELVVLHADGRLVASIPIHPVEKDKVIVGMRFVEAIEWLSSTQVVVSGSVNPSTAEYVVFNVPDRSIARQFFDDGGGAAFSKDGKHVAYITGSPHFGDPKGQKPTLNIDGKEVYSFAPELKMRGAPVWKDDDFSIAVMAHNDGSNADFVLVRDPASPGFAVSQLPPISKKRLRVYWGGEDLYAVPVELNGAPSPGAETLRLASSSKGWEHAGKMGEATASPLDAKAWIAAERQVVHESDQEPNFWCENCVASSALGRASKSEH